MKFTKQKNGYDEKQVEEYISSLSLSYDKKLAEKDQEIKQLKNEVETIRKKEENIGLALTAAVDKAKEIEESSQNIYKLKLEQLTILYSKWEILLNEMIKKYPDIKAVSNVKEDMNNLKNSIKSALKDEFHIELMSKTPATDPIRALLNKLTQARTEKGYSSAKPKKAKTIVRKVKISSNEKTDLAKLEEKTSQIKPISAMNLENDERYENLVDKFLNTDSEADINDGLSKILSVPDYSQSNGKFDLNEAINPTEGLDEIMKSFDFYKKN